MEGEEILNPGKTTADVVYSYSYPSSGGGSRTTLEQAPDDDGAVLVVLGPGAPSASTDGGPVTYPDVATELLVTSDDWITAAQFHSDVSAAAPLASQTSSVAGDVVLAVEHSFPSPAPATRSRSVPPTGPVVGESYTDMLVSHLGGSYMSPAAAWNNTDSATASAAISGVAAAYRGVLNLNLNAAVTAEPDTNAVGFGYAIDTYQGVADLGLHHTAAVPPATEPDGGYYYSSNSGMARPFAAREVDEAEMEGGGLVADAAAVSKDEVAGAVTEPVRGGRFGELGLAATSLATAGLVAGGLDTPVAAIALFGMLVAGVILITVRVLRAYTVVLLLRDTELVVNSFYCNRSRPS